MKPDRPVRDAYDEHYQISPHFEKTPGLTAIPEISHNYIINRRLKRKIGALYSKYGFERCPNHGLFWAGWPQWTMIPDRDKMVLLVVEMKEKDIGFWYKIDDEVRKILAESGLAERGVCVRYYEFWAGWKLEEHKESKEAALIRAQEQAAQEDLESLADLEEEAEDFESPLLLTRAQLPQLERTGSRRIAALPGAAGQRIVRRSSPTPGERRQRLEDRMDELLRVSPSLPTSGESFGILPGLNLPLNTNRAPRRTGPDVIRARRGQARSGSSMQRPTRFPFSEN